MQYSEWNAIDRSGNLRQHIDFSIIHLDVTHDLNVNTDNLDGAIIYLNLFVYPFSVTTKYRMNIRISVTDLTIQADYIYRDIYIFYCLLNVRVCMCMCVWGMCTCVGTYERVRMCMFELWERWTERHTDRLVHSV